MERLKQNYSEETVEEVKRAVWYGCMYMYMLYCESDKYAKTPLDKREEFSNLLMDPMYIGWKLATFIKMVERIWVDTFCNVSLRNVCPETIYKHMDVWLWTTDYCFQNYPKKVQDFLKTNDEIMKLFPDDVRDENWYII